MTGPDPKYSANEVILDQLDLRLAALEEKTKSDAIGLIAPITYGLDDRVREAIEARKNGPGTRSRLVVVLETEGGFAETVERIADTFRHHYRHVSFIVPSYAFSAGTILVMSGDAIWMDYYSVLGPIDPQLEKGDKLIPAIGYLEQYERLIKKSRDGKMTDAELAFLLDKFDPGELYWYEQQKALSISLLKNWLVNYKFKNWKKTKSRGIKVTPAMRTSRANTIAQKLQKIDRWHLHSRGIPMKILIDELNLKIDNFAKNPSLNTCVRDYHKLLTDFMIRLNQRYAVHVLGRSPFVYLS